MANDMISSSLDMVRRHKLSDLAHREATTDSEMLRRLIDRAYRADLETHLDTAEKPGTPAPPIG
jgi:hypothetical protein